MPGSDPDATQNTNETEAEAEAEAEKAPPSSSRASVPPSEPRPSRASLANLDAQVDAPARLQMIVALILGLVLVAIPLYLWRRPRAESIPVSRTAVDGGALSAASFSGAGTPSANESESKVTLSDPRVLACQDPGPKKTPPDQCDHLPDFEKALAKAIDESATCLPKDAGGGTIQYVAEVSFKKKLITVTTPKDARTMKNAKAAAACASAVKGRLSVVALDSMTHQHARYKIAITATYPGAVK